MSASSIQLKWGEGSTAHCICVLIVPGKALEEAGYIRAVHRSGSSNKHELHALAQTAYYQFQDDELELDRTAAPILIDIGGETESLEEAMVLMRIDSGEIRAVLSGDLSARKLLESANRFCTRWVRLDI